MIMNRSTAMRIRERVQRPAIPALWILVSLGVPGAPALFGLDSAAAREDDADAHATSESKDAEVSEFRQRQRAELETIPPAPDPRTDPDTHPIDALVRAWRAEHDRADPPVANEALVVRRLYFDTIGLPPTPEEVRAFVENDRPDRVDRLVKRLLDDDRAYAEHWITWWNDLLRNDEQTSIDGLRQPVTDWLYRSLEANKPYDRMVAELLDPGQDGPSGYLNGILWRGRINLSQRPPVQAAQNTAQVFLGTMIRCASCHDGFTTDWTLRDAYGLAAFFSEGPLEMARCDAPTGLTVPPRFLYDDLGHVEPDADLEARRAAVARMVTRPRNERFAQVMVNRLWNRLIGRALVEPIDEFYFEDAEHPKLLAWLADDFMRHDYNLKHTIERILTSRIYREQADTSLPEEPPFPIGPVPRRLTAEQWLDAFDRITGRETRLGPDQTMGTVLDERDPNGPVRAWRRKVPSALAIALGRPNREQVTTEREHAPSMLLALEVTNGSTLASRLRQGAEALLASDWGRLEPADALDELVGRAYARPSNASERALLEDLVGRPGQPADERSEGVQDLIWILLNSPEFLVLR